MSDTNKQDIETIDALSALGRTLIRTEGWRFGGKELIATAIRAALREQWATAYEAAALFDVAYDLETPCLDALDAGARGRATKEERGAYFVTFNANIEAEVEKSWGRSMRRFQLDRELNPHMSKAEILASN